MSKKEKSQNQGPPAEAPEKQTFSDPPAVAQAAAVNQQAASQTGGQTVSHPQMPVDMQELIRATLISIIAQKRTSALAATLTSLVRAVEKALKRYVKHTPALREFVRNELVSAGYTIADTTVDYGGDLYNVEIVVLYRSFDEIVEAIKTGRMSRLLRPLASNEVDPLYDKRTR
jgi:hypothetical protein